MILTPLQLIAGASLLQNQGIIVNPEFTAASTAFDNQPLIAPLLNAIEVGGEPVTPGVPTSAMLQPATVVSLQTMAANSCPALSDSIPSTFTTLSPLINPAGFSGLLESTANTYVGNGDLGKFSQALSTAVAYATVTNQFVISAVNSGTYLANTFTGMDNTTTGDITSVNLDTKAFGSDLANLGQLIDLSDLGNLGSPLALVRRIITLVGNVPVIAVAFVNAGVSEDVVVNLNNPTVSVSDTSQKLMYQAMTTITGDDLTQILTVIGVTTVGITTMADLLNPVKIFPNSFQTLTTFTASGLRGIYLDSTGTVNSKLAEELPAFIVSTLA